MRDDHFDDKPMEEDPGPMDQGRGRSPDRPHRRRHSRSASPRARRSDHARAPRVEADWGFNQLNWCILHRSSCDICREYGSHFNEAALMDDRSFLRCVEKRTKLAEGKSRELVEDARDEANRYRAQAMDLRDQLDRLQEDYDALQREWDEHKCAPIATIAVPGPSDQASRVTRVPPPPTRVPPTPRALPPPAPPAGGSAPGYIPGPFADTIARHTRPRAPRASNAPAAPPASAVPPPPFVQQTPAAPAPPQKGGRSTAPHPASLLHKRRPVVDPYDDEDDDETEELFMGKDYQPRPQAKAPLISRSNFANQIGAILGNRRVGGRAWTLDPKTPEDWDHARRALDSAHEANVPQTGELLRLMRRYIADANAVAAGDRANGTKNLTDVQRHALLQWRVPDWESVTRWNYQSGTVEKTETTRGEARNRRVAAGNRVDSLRSALSDRLGLSVDGQPHPHLGDIASPRHTDHPELWREYARYITKTPPRGFAYGPDGYPFQRHVRAFLRFTPLFRGGGGYLANHHGQVRVLALIARQAYSAGLRAQGITLNAPPDWSPIEFVPDSEVTDEGIIVELARRGITEAEALDASDFAFSWLTETLVSEQNADVRQFITGTLSLASALATAQPWPEIMQFEYNEAHGRWLPIVPAAAEIVTPTVSGHSAGDAPSSSAVGGAPLQETPLPPAPSTSEDVDITVEPEIGPRGEPPDMEIDGDDGTAGGSK